MATYKRTEDTMTFFEIDPMVDRLSRDPQWFSYISNCASGPINTVLGDARLTLAKETAGSYDLLIIDAFSSDAVPTHLLTVEAIDGYLALLNDLHKGRNAGTSWIVLIDITALACIIFSLTGFWLILKQPSRRSIGNSLAMLGIFISLFAYILSLH